MIAPLTVLLFINRIELCNRRGRGTPADLGALRARSRTRSVVPRNVLKTEEPRISGAL
jgi:hypothetical protein